MSTHFATSGHMSTYCCRTKVRTTLETSTHGLVLCWHPPCPQGSMLTAACHQFGVDISWTKVRTGPDTIAPTLIFGGAGGQDENQFVFDNEEQTQLATSLVWWCELLSDICIFQKTCYLSKNTYFFVKNIWPTNPDEF